MPKDTVKKYYQITLSTCEPKEVTKALFSNLDTDISNYTISEVVEYYPLVCQKVGKDD